MGAILSMFSHVVLDESMATRTRLVENFVESALNNGESWFGYVPDFSCAICSMAYPLGNRSCRYVAKK